MKKTLLIVLLFSFFLIPQQAFAHVLQADGSVGAVLHIDPDDEPYAGQPASFFFEFKDKQNKFSPQNCDCTIRILENGKELYSQALFQNNQNPSLTNASFSYTFPQLDVYQVVVSGKPLANEFQPFTLTYDIRVDRQASPNSQTQTQPNFFSIHLIHFVLAGGIFIAGIIAIIQKQLQKPKK